MKFWKALTCTALAALGLAGAAQAQPKVVISQIYGAGGNSGAVYNRDYIELFNAGDAAQDLTGWSVQIGSSTGVVGGAAAQIVALSGTIPAGGYLLVAGGSGNAANTAPAGVALPVTPDINNTPQAGNQVFPGFALAAANGKAAVVSSTTSLGVANPFVPGPPPATLVDFVGFGTATAFEGTVAPAPSTTNAIFRANAGCTDTNVNGSDFAALPALPRNSATALNVCGVGPIGPTGANSTATSESCPNTTVTFSVTVTPGTNPTITSVVGDFTSIGGTTGVAFSNGGSGNVYTVSQTITTATTPGQKSIPVVITDGAALTGNASIIYTVNNCTLGITSSSVSPGGVCSGESVTFNLTVRKNTIPGQGPSTGIVVALDLTNVNLFNPLSQNMTLVGVDPNNADRLLYTLTHTIPAAQLSGSGSVGITITDAQNNLFNGTGATPNPFNVLLAGPCTPANSDVVISQVYGGGGATSGSPTFKDDYVELFNRGSAPVDVTGWTLQYASAAGPTTPPWNVSSTLSATINPGQYYLVRLSTAGVGILGADLPVTPDFIPTAGLSLSATSGKIALVSDAIALVPTNPTDASIKDLVGYGSANGFEGVAAAPGTENTNAAFRLQNGCRDTNQNAADFAIAAALPRNSASPTNSCSTPTTDNCCRGTTCNSVTAGSCTGVVAGSNSIVVTSCGAGTAFATCCYADFNHDGIQSIDDLFLYFNAYFTSSPYANFAGDGVATPTIDDLFLYINAYFGTCAP